MLWGQNCSLETIASNRQFRIASSSMSVCVCVVRQQFRFFPCRVVFCSSSLFDFSVFRLENRNNHITRRLGWRKNVQSFSYRKLLGKHNLDLFLLFFFICRIVFSFTLSLGHRVRLKCEQSITYKCVVRNSFGLGYLLDWEVVTVMMICVPCGKAALEANETSNLWTIITISFLCTHPLTLTLFLALKPGGIDRACMLPHSVLRFYHLYFYTFVIDI